MATVDFKNMYTSMYVYLCDIRGSNYTGYSLNATIDNVRVWGGIGKKTVLVRPYNETSDSPEILNCFGYNGELLKSNTQVYTDGNFLVIKNAFIISWLPYDGVNFGVVIAYDISRNNYYTGGINSKTSIGNGNYKIDGSGNSENFKRFYLKCNSVLRGDDHIFEFPVNRYNASGVLGGYLMPIANYSSFSSPVSSYTASALNSTNNSILGGYLYQPGYVPKNPAPNEDGGFSSEGGGGGKFDNTSDNIPIPNLPTLRPLASGFLNVYVADMLTFNQFNAWLWEDDILADMQDIYSDKMQAIVGVYTIPYNPPIDSQKEQIVLGNIGSGIISNVVTRTQQYSEIDFGEIQIEEFWGNYLDYSPYTKIQIYLPFIGYKQLNTDIFMNKKIGVKYICNIVDGLFVCYITADSNVVCIFDGTFFQQLPISNYDGSNLYKSFAGAVTGIASAVIGGMTAPIPAAGLGQVDTAMNFKPSLGIASAATNVMNAKPTIELGGAIRGNMGTLALRYPYITIERPRQALPEKYNVLHGYPSLISDTLSNFSGFTVVDDMHLENISATSGEIDEIMSLLKSGVII